MQNAHRFAREVALKRSNELQKFMTETVTPISKMSETEFQNIFSDRTYASFLTTATARERNAVKRLNLLASVAFATGLLFLLAFVGLNL